MTLTWNFQNALAGSCVTGEGLSGQGREFVREAQRLGILLDVSHLSDRAFWDLCEISEKPVVASHSNSRAVCANRRNLTDEQFLALCRLGGTAGINLYGAFLTDGAPTLDDVYRHVDRFLSLGGEGHEAGGGRAVDGSVVEGQRQAHRRVGFDRAVLGGPDLRLDAADAQDAGLRRVDDGREGLAAERADVGNGEGCVLHDARGTGVAQLEPPLQHRHGRLACFEHHVHRGGHQLVAVGIVRLLGDGHRAAAALSALLGLLVDLGHARTSSS